MPWGDRTGPWGLGPMTGRAAGYCAGYPVPGFMNPYVRGLGHGFGFGRGFRGRGFGRGRWFGWAGYYPYSYPAPYYGITQPYVPYSSVPYQTFGPNEEKAYLEEVVVSLENELKEVNKRIEELVKETKK